MHGEESASQGLCKLAQRQLQKFSNYKGHEAVYQFPYLKNGIPTGIHLIIALHNTKRGPGLGGIRYRARAYQNLTEAIEDALNLSFCMTQKILVADLPYGGAKAILYVSEVYADFFEKERTSVFLWVGECIERLSGKYVTAEDMGVHLSDLETIARSTSYVRGVTLSQNTKNDITSEMTAYGVYQGIRAAVRFVYPENPRIFDKHFAIQGCLGKVGFNLCKMLSKEGAFLFIADIKEKGEIEHAFKKANIAKRFQIVDPNKIHSRLCDMFVPCAHGGVLNSRTIPQMLCKIVAGCANNQLASTKDGMTLHKQHILYVPDFVINAGGCMAVAYEDMGIDYIRFQVGRVYAQTKNILETAQEKEIPPFVYAEEKAEKILLSDKGGV